MVQGVIIDENNCIVDCNPATGETIEKVKCTTKEEINNIVIPNAKNAFVKSGTNGWSDVPLDERIDLLKKGLLKLKEKSNDLATLITKEMGKPIGESKGEVSEGVNMDGFLKMVHDANKDVILGNNDESQSVIVRDPLGVVVVLSPWNFPVGEIILLVLPALAAGNVVVVKPSEVTPLSGKVVVETLASVLPEGVLQIVYGDGEIGQHLVEHPDTKMIAMTGSTNVGKNIMSRCSTSLKRLVLELGGKDPMIIFKDADIDVAAADAVANSLFNTGQVCCSVERIYVDESIKSKFEQKVIEEAKKWKVGNGIDENNKVGPMVSMLQRNHVEEQVNDAIKSGAKLLYQSDVPNPTSVDSDGGNSQYYPVTILSDVKQTMDIQRRETFGPVVSISTFSGSEEDAIELGNDTEYGLASYVYTSDLQKASRVARKIQAGQVGINCYSITNAKPGCPWVGHKMSGFGYHSGMDGFRQFSVPKSLVYNVPAPHIE